MRWIGCMCLLLAATAVTAQEVTLPLERYDEVRTRAHPEPEPELSAVDIPESGKVLILSGVLPPAELAVELAVRAR